MKVLLDGFNRRSWLNIRCLCYSQLYISVFLEQGIMMMLYGNSYDLSGKVVRKKKKDVLESKKGEVTLRN